MREKPRKMEKKKKTLTEKLWKTEINKTEANKMI